MIFPAVLKETKINIYLRRDKALQKEFENNKNLSIIVNLAAVIEAGFLDSEPHRKLRKLDALATPLPHQINETHLSFFNFLSDAYAYNGKAVLFPQSLNTTNFESAVNDWMLPFVTLSGNHLHVASNEVDEIPRITLRLFGESV